jgi:hypothetical protein
MRRWIRWSAWLCLSLMFWTVAAESTHNHPTQTEAASCAICMAAHTASPAVSAGHGTSIFVRIDLLEDQDVIAKARFDTSDRGIRGPPFTLQGTQQQ